MKEETQKIYHQESKIRNSRSSFIGSALLIVATILPCVDRILCWFWPILDTAKDARGVYLSINIWQACLYLSPVAISISAAFFHPNRRLYYFPITMSAYSAIVYFSPVLGFNIKFLEWNSWLAAVISIIAVIPVWFMLKHVKALSLAERADDDFYDDFAIQIEKLKQENETLKNKLKSQNYQYEK